MSGNVVVKTGASTTAGASGDLTLSTGSSVGGNGGRRQYW